MARDEAEFHDFVQARWRSLVRYAYVLTGDPGHAEDVVQVVLERTWRRWSHVRAERPEVYVRTAIAREAVSWRRRLARRPVERPLPPVDGGQPETDGGHRGIAAAAAGRDGSEGRALQALLWAELQHLPPRMRAVVVLRVWEDLSEAEVAAVLGCSTGSVKSQLSRGLARLRERAGLREAVGLAPGTNEGRTA